MSDETDSTLEEDVIEEKRDEPAQETTTEFSQISFFVDERTQDEPLEGSNDVTDSFDAVGDDTGDDFDESCNTLETPDPEED